MMQHLLYVEFCFRPGVAMATAVDALDELNVHLEYGNKWVLLSKTSAITGTAYPHKIAYLWDAMQEGAALDPSDSHHGAAFKKVVGLCGPIEIAPLIPHKYSPKTRPEPFPPPPNTNKVNHYFLVAKLTANPGMLDVLVDQSAAWLGAVAGKLRWKLLASGTYGERSVLNFWRLDDGSALLDGLRAFEEEKPYTSLLSASERHQQDMYTSILGNPLGSNPDLH